MDYFRLAPDVNTVLMYFFLKSFRSLGARISTHGNFMVFLVFLVLFWPLLLGLLMFRNYSVAMLVSVFLLCLFSVRISIKKSVLYARERKPFISLIAAYGTIFEFGFICTFVIDVLRMSLKSKELLPVFVIVTSRKLSCLFSFSNSIVY